MGTGLPAALREASGWEYPGRSGVRVVGEPGRRRGALKIINRLGQWSEIRKVRPVEESPDVAAGRDGELALRADDRLILPARGCQRVRRPPHPFEASGAPA